MTLRLSVRAEARERYLELKEGKGAAPEEGPPTPDPSPPLASLAGGGESQAVPASADLTARLQALYENSDVPVREIAAIAEVSERTLYKYARKLNWKPRYDWMPDGARPPSRPGLRRWTEAMRRKHAARFAPVKGAGGRFIRRADAGQPFAAGLKALDPQGVARALVACAAAAPMAAAAQNGAERALLNSERIRALTVATKAARKLQAFRQASAMRRHDRWRAANWVGYEDRRPHVAITAEEDAAMDRVLSARLTDAMQWLDTLSAEMDTKGW